MPLTDTDNSYVGRFAPSPTGPLHFGSLVGALASFLDARAHNGRWLLRIEDIDPLREPSGAADQILRTLEAHQLLWDGPVLYQSSRSDAYEAAISILLANGDAYYCPCSRKQLAQTQGQHLFGCREYEATGHGESAIRFKVQDERIQLQDQIQGLLEFNVQAGRDDFVLKRKEGFYAYQLAVVVDDAWQGISHVVRGSDLVDSIPWQLMLQTSLVLPQPVYAHIPVITNNEGQKLSKQNRAPALINREAPKNLYRALQALAVKVPAELKQASSNALLDWAVRHWRLGAIAPRMSIPEATLGDHNLLDR